MIFTKKYSPRIGDFGKDGMLTLRSILELLEQVGFCHSEEVKDKLMAVENVEIAWVLAEWTVKLGGNVRPGEELTFNTWVTGKPSASSVMREMEVLDSAGNAVIQAMSRFALFNVETGKLTRITPELFESYRPQPQPKNSFPSGRMREQPAYDTQTQITVRKADMDFNGHVHNSVYMDYAQELLAMPREHIGYFRVGYKTPVKEGEVLTLKALGQGEKMGIFHQDGTLCTLLEFGDKTLL